MADQELSPLSLLWVEGQPARLEGTGVSVVEQPDRHKLILRGEEDREFRRTVKACTGATLSYDSDTPSGDDPCCMMLSPGEWLITSLSRPHLDRELAAVLQQIHASVFNANSAWVALELSGNNARTLLAQGCNQDLHPKEFPTGTFSRTNVARIPVLIFKPTGDNRFDLYVDRSLAMDLWLWLRDTATNMTS
jgi:sarcosine oxidase subunit gamma